MTTQKKGRRAAGGRNSTIDANSPVTADMFEYTWAVIDSAVTGAMLAGLHPSCIEPVLAFWFLNVAAKVRNKPAHTATSWLQGDIFDVVLQAVARFARSYEGKRRDGGEAEELAHIIELSHAERPAPTRLDLKGQNKQAADIVEWALGIVSQTAAMPSEIVELVLLIECLKVAAMSPDVDEEIYCVVRQSAPLVRLAYEPILSGGN